MESAPAKATSMKKPRKAFEASFSLTRVKISINNSLIKIIYNL